MSTGSELSIMYQQQQYYNTAPIILSEHQQYRISNHQHQDQQPVYMDKYYNNKGSRHDHMASHSLTKYNNSGGNRQHNNTTTTSRHQSNHFRVVSPPLSVASSSTISSTNSYYNTTTGDNSAKLFPPTKSTHSASVSQTHAGQQAQKRQSTAWNFTWLVFMNEKWVPFDIINQTKLEQTLTVGGTFVDINDSHFPDVKRVRVFPRNNYLSYLGVKYRLSRIMQPDAYLDHVAVAEEKQPPTTTTTNTITTDNNTTDATITTGGPFSNSSMSDRPPSLSPPLSFKRF